MHLVLSIQWTVSVIWTVRLERFLLYYYTTVDNHWWGKPEQVDWVCGFVHMKS